MSEKTSKPDFKKGPPTRFIATTRLSREQARTEIEALREAIAYHDDLYYVKNRPVISDDAYDRLFRRLQDLEEAFPAFRSETSPTQRVGAEPAAGLAKVEHTAPMLSLDAAVEEDEVRAFDAFIRRHAEARTIAYVLEPKFDGLSVEVVYRAGLFHGGSTRGDGQVGENISANLKTVRALPLRLRNDPPSFLAVRAEILLRKRDFHRLNRERIERGDEPFANPRNAAAGTIRRLDPREVARHPLDIVFYDILAMEDGTFSAHWDELEHLAAWGLKTDPHNRRVSSFDAVCDYHAALEAARDDLDHEIDGIVIKLDDVALRERLGTRQRSPRWALARKFAPREEVTTLEDIVVQVGMTGILTPVALLQPVDIGGVTVSRATLHNESEVHRKDVRVGDTVRVVRAGDVIPEVLERIGMPGKKRDRPFHMPETCPACGAAVVEEGAYYLCPAGLSCPAQLVGHLTHYASREAMDIEGLGDKTARQLVRKGLVASLADLYELSVDELMRLEGFAKKSAQALHRAIQDRKDVRLDRFLYALGIRHVGEHGARVLARAFGSLEALRRASREDLEAVPEIGPEIAVSVHRFFRQEQHRRVLDRLAAAGVRVRDMPAAAGATPLAGKTFVFTGELEHFTRAQAEELVESLGGRATSSVSAQTNYLVAGAAPGSKLDEAKKRNIEVIDEAAFQRLVSG